MKRIDIQNMTFFVREENYIPNSIRTQSFNAKMGSNCNNASCIISSYSMFDKYFNQTFTNSTNIHAKSKLSTASGEVLCSRDGWETLYEKCVTR